MRKTLLVVLSLFFITSSILSVSASGPVFWRVNTRAEVEKGDVRGISIADNGAMTLAPSMVEVFDTKQAYIWSAVADGAGNIYLGTGNEGRIFKVDPSGKGSLFYKTSELSVMALAVDAQGNVYAGTSPDGKVYRIAPSGEAKVFFEPKTKYIWSLALDQQGRLLIGTGDNGTIYRANPDGSGAPLAKTTQTNITALRVDSSGNIIAGTDPGGLVLRISPDGQAFTLFDSSQREVRDLAIGKNGEIYVLALAESAGTGATNTTPGAATPSAPTVVSADEGVTITISDVQVVDSTSSPSGSAATSANAGNPPKSALYKIDANGASDPLWDLRDSAAFAIALENDGQILIGTGQKGRIYSLYPGRYQLLLAQSSEGQTSRFVRSGERFYAAASNLGKLFRLSPEPSANGIYTSSVRDAQTTAQWGRISWIGEGAIELQTRSGNTGTPDSTWSNWSQPVTNPEGGAIQSPPARYLQWRATLRRSSTQQNSPRMREVTVSYLPRNLAPRITSLSVLPVGVNLQAAIIQPQSDLGSDQSGGDAGSTPALVQIPPRRTFQRGAVSLQWQAEDRNGDSIEFSIYYRNASAGDFFPLKTGLRDNYFTIDPNALPDGRYVFKIVASDTLSNPANLALTDEQETEPVEVDNTPPVASADPPKALSGQFEISFRAVDATSIIRRAEYQIDGGQWKSIFPTDGIADSKREDFRVTVTLNDGKSHIIAFRAFDANSNVGSAQAAINAR
jgi:sugar lactone lactonase YvrE